MPARPTKHDSKRSNNRMLRRVRAHANGSVRSRECGNRGTDPLARDTVWDEQHSAPRAQDGPRSTLANRGVRRGASRPPRSPVALVLAVLLPCLALGSAAAWQATRAYQGAAEPGCATRPARSRWHSTTNSRHSRRQRLPSLPHLRCACAPTRRPALRAGRRRSRDRSVLCRGRQQRRAQATAIAEHGLPRASPCRPLPSGRRRLGPHPRVRTRESRNLGSVHRPSR
jgi:hypothetical protein